MHLVILHSTIIIIFKPLNKGRPNSATRQTSFVSRIIPIYVGVHYKGVYYPRISHLHLLKEASFPSWKSDQMTCQVSSTNSNHSIVEFFRSSFYLAGIIVSNGHLYLNVRKHFLSQKGNSDKNGIKHRSRI